MCVKQKNKKKRAVTYSKLGAKLTILSCFQPQTASTASVHLLYCLHVAEEQDETSSHLSDFKTTVRSPKLNSDIANTAGPVSVWLRALVNQCLTARRWNEKENLQTLRVGPSTNRDQMDKIAVQQKKNRTGDSPKASVVYSVASFVCFEIFSSVDSFPFLAFLFVYTYL